MKIGKWKERAAALLLCMAALISLFPAPIAFAASDIQKERFVFDQPKYNRQVVWGPWDGPNGEKFNRAPFADRASIPNNLFAEETRPVEIPSHFSLPTGPVQNIPVYLIGHKAFLNSKIPSIKLPETIQEIHENAFTGCTLLNEVIIDEKNPTYKVGTEGYVYKINADTTPVEISLVLPSCTKLTIPEGVTSLKQSSFRCAPEYKALETLHIPASLTDIQFEYAPSFDKNYKLTNILTGVKTVTVDEANTKYRAQGNKIYEKGSDKCLAEFGVIEDLVIPDGTTKIPDNAYKGTPGLKTVTIPASVKTIGEMAFAECPDLTTVTILPGSQMTIMYRAFGGCKNLTTVNLGEGVKNIAYYAFSESGLTDVTIPDSVTSIGDRAFQSCPNLSSITIGKGLDSIPNMCFNGKELNENIKKLTIPSNIKTVGEYAFGDLAIEELVIEDGVESIGEAAFGGAKLKQFHLPKTLTGPIIPYSGIEESYTVAEGNPVYFAEDGIVYKWFDEAHTKAELYKYPAKKQNSQVDDDGKTILIVPSQTASGIPIVSLADGVLSNVRPVPAKLFLPKSLECMKYLIGWDAYHNSVLDTVFYEGSEADWKALPQEGTYGPNKWEWPYYPGKYGTTNLENMVAEGRFLFNAKPEDLMKGVDPDAGHNRLDGTAKDHAYAGTGTAAEPYKVLIAKSAAGAPPNTPPRQFWGVAPFAVTFEQRAGDTVTGELLHSYNFDMKNAWPGTLYPENGGGNGGGSEGLRFRFTPYNESRFNDDGTLDIGFSWKGTFGTFWKDWTYTANVKALSSNAFQPGDEVTITYYGGYNETVDGSSGWDTSYDIDFNVTDTNANWTTTTTLDKNGSVTLSGENKLVYGGNYRIKKVDAKPVLPAVPTLNAQAGDTEVTLTWNKVDGATGYELYQDGTKVDAVLGADTTTYTVTGLTNDQSYKFELTANSPDGVSGKSNAVSVTPKAKVPEGGGNVPAAKAPDAPVLQDERNTKDVWGNNHSIEVKWTAPNDNGSPITGYIIECDGRKVGETDGSAREFTITGLTNGTVYSVTVTAVNAGGSAESNAVEAVPNSAGPDNSRPGGSGSGTGGGGSIPLAVQRTNVEGTVSKHLDEIWLQFTHNVASDSSNKNYVSIRKNGAGQDMSASKYVIDPAIDFIHRQFIFIKLNEALEDGATYTITIAPGVEAQNGSMVTTETQTLTFTVGNKDSGGGSGGGAGGGSVVPGTKPTDPDVKEDTKTEVKPDGTKVDTTTRTDGSTTVVETKKDGTVTTTDTNKAGDKSVAVAKPDGSSETKIEMKNGTTSTTTVDKNGKTEAQVKVPEAIVEQAAKADKPVELPIPAVPVTKDQDNAPVIQVDTGKAENVTVQIPVENVTPGTVAVIVHPDGTEEVIRKTASDENGLTVTLEKGATLKVVDNSKTFSDPIPDWSADAVDFATSHELFGGTSATEFTPNAPMTRAMLATVLWRLENETAATADGSFGDVAEGQWYSEAISWAAENKIVNGTGGGFAPNASITREQLAVMLYRYAGSPATSGTNLTFNDTNMVSGYATEAMAWAVENDIIGGVGGNTLNPQGNATRAQVATMLMRFVNK